MADQPSATASAPALLRALLAWFWRVFDQGIWVVCEAALLLLGVQQSMLTIYKFARRESDLRTDNEMIKREAAESRRPADWLADQLALVEAR